MPRPSELHLAVRDDSECLIAGKVVACSQLKPYTRRRLVRHIVCAVAQAEHDEVLCESEPRTLVRKLISEKVIWNGKNRSGLC